MAKYFSIDAGYFIQDEIKDFLQTRNTCIVYIVHTARFGFFYWLSDLVICFSLSRKYLLNNLSIRMRTFVASLLFLSFVALSSGLSCWDTDDKFYAMRATNTINIKQCESGAKSCKKEWYKASSPELSLPTSFIRSLPGRVLGRHLLQAELRHRQRHG